MIAKGNDSPRLAGKPFDLGVLFLQRGFLLYRLGFFEVFDVLFHHTAVISDSPSTRHHCGIERWNEGGGFGGNREAMLR